MSDHPELAFFNQLSGRLEIELTEPAAPIAPHMLNLQAAPTAKLVSLRFHAQVFEGDDLRELTEAELASLAFAAPHIALRGDTGGLVAHDAPDGRAFTVRDLIRAVEETERQTRGDSEWLGGIDVHHIFFEGLGLEDDGTWFICWGS